MALTARTLIREALDGDKDVVERQLSHGRDEALGGADDRAQFFTERAKMMREWADYLDPRRSGSPVVQLRA